MLQESSGEAVGMKTSTVFSNHRDYLRRTHPVRSNARYPYLKKANICPTGEFEYEIEVEYEKTIAPLNVECKLTAIVSLGKLTDRTEFDDGVWEASYSESWLGKHKATVFRADGVNADKQTVEWEVMWYSSPIDALSSLMAQDPEAFLHLDHDDLGDLPEIPIEEMEITD